MALFAIGCSSWGPVEREINSAGRPVCWIRSRQSAAQIYLPDPEHGHYRGPRFDWSGMIGFVEFDGTKYFGSLYPHYDDTSSHDYNATGPAEEFGMTSPLGYDEAGPGDTFIKIGVGHLLRTADEKEYLYHRRYQVAKPAGWQVESVPGAVRFHQVLTDPRGWGYDYRKTVTLSDDGPELVITHRLTNTGTRPIDTDVYCHNIVQFDGRGTAVGNYIEIPFDAKLIHGEGNHDHLSQSSRRITVVQPFAKLESAKGEWKIPAGQAFVYGGEVGNGLQSIRISGDQTPIALQYYISAAAVCLEPFLGIHLKPGQTREWTLRYRFAKSDPAMRQGEDRITAVNHGTLRIF